MMCPYVSKVINTQTNLIYNHKGQVVSEIYRYNFHSVPCQLWNCKRYNRETKQCEYRNTAEN